MTAIYKNYLCKYNKTRIEKEMEEIYEEESRGCEEQTETLE